MKRTVLILLAILTLLSCNDRQDEPAFLAFDQVRLEMSGKEVFVYDPATCQLSFNRTAGEFRAGTDNMSDYFVVKFHRVPAHLNEEVDADFTWTTERSVERKKNITLKVMKLEGDVLWLWGSSSRTALIVRILD